MQLRPCRVGDDRRDDLIASILEHQLDDGGWNCRSPRTGSIHGSFHTTINVVEGERYKISSSVLTGEMVVLHDVENLYRG